MGNNNKIIQVKEETLKLLLVFKSEMTNPFQTPESYFKEIIKNKDPKKMRYAKIKLYDIDKGPFGQPYSISDKSVYVKFEVISGCPTYWETIQLFNDENSTTQYESVFFNSSLKNNVYTIKNKPIIPEKSFIIVNKYTTPEQHFECRI